MWAAGELAARSRFIASPRHGIHRKTIRRVCFEFDLDLNTYIRRMYSGAYETEIVGLLEKLLRTGDTFVDVGANIGYLSGMAAGIVGTTGRVLSFEPAPSCFKRLEALKALNPGFEWDIYPLALGSESAAMELAISKTNIGWNTLVAGQIPGDLEAGRVSVEVRKLDDCLYTAGVDRVRVLKIDTEGFEAQVVLGAQNWLKAGKIDHLIVEIQPRQGTRRAPDFETMLELLSAAGYEPRQTRAPYRLLQSDGIVNGDNVWFCTTD